MDWLKKKTKEVTSKVAKMQNDHKIKGQTFSGTGYSMQAPSAAPPPATCLPARPTSAVDPTVSEEERMLRRQQQAEAAAKRGAPAPKKRMTNGGDASNARPDHVVDDDSTTSEAYEQAKALEQMHIAAAGFNPYEPTISSSTAARAAATTAQSAPSPARDPSSSLARPPLPSTHSLPPATAATICKILQNILDNPDDDKFHKLRVSNGAIQAKIASVPEAVAFLHDIGFDAVVLDDNEEYFVLNATRTSTDALVAAVARLQPTTS
ncbi:hypothetical protein H310_14170 [Aphanomyces invadans]|uniref:PUB domain-containing protein n=1 Tax=Aphanomyces invadans TaxID=157072 RepID=A0A024TAI4_9STRA|nr:hypothetical protein H310_14170 [Aphanomyces invadans]ETV91160.1 hypothetical protein H310_14170 [Aphanomyces invadans]|eukprot:XP_008880191.1 hypothetical protein H310_14170 [Aphanomyces invadans]